MRCRPDTGDGGLLSGWERRAVDEVIHRVRSHLAAELVRVLLFGSQARGEARPDSDVDLLLIFRSLPPDREPYASRAEQIADDVAATTGVPVTVWSVALADLEMGQRTPMLVDALDDGVLLWPAAAPVPCIDFTPWDALRCAAALLDRVDEGSGEVAFYLHSADVAAASRRGRGDVVRLCTAVLLLAGETRPRRARAVHRAAHRLGKGGANGLRPILQWAARSFGPGGRDEQRFVPPPPGGFERLAFAVDTMREMVIERAVALSSRLRDPRNPARASWI